MTTPEHGARARANFGYADRAAKDPQTIYFRNLNNGGQRDIATSRSLEAGSGTSSFGGGDQVRAWFGPAPGRPSVVTVEFTTAVPGAARPHAAGNFAYWSAEGRAPRIPSGRLPIEIRRFAYPDGTVAVPAGPGRFTLTKPDGSVRIVPTGELP